MSTQGTEHVDTVIVGGGQAGLATGYHLKRLGHEPSDPRRPRSRRRRVADALGLASPVHVRPVLGAAGLAVPRARLVVPHQGRDGRLPGGVRVGVRSHVRTGVTVDRLTREGDRFVLTPGRLPPRGPQRRRRDGSVPGPQGAAVRERARPIDRPTPFQRVPAAVAAPDPVPCCSSARAIRGPTSRWRSFASIPRGCPVGTPATCPCRSTAVAVTSASECSGSWAITCSRSGPRSDGA